MSEKKEKTRFLSKAQRKRLEKIVEKKKKKENVSTCLIFTTVACIWTSYNKFATDCLVSDDMSLVDEGPLAHNFLTSNLTNQD